MIEAVDQRRPRAGEHRNMSSNQTLRGTPVVPGVAYAPVVTATVAVAPAAVAAFESTGFPDAEAALAAFDGAVAATADGLAARAGRVSGAAAEVLTASAGLARDKGLRLGAAKNLQAGQGPVAAVRGRSSSSSRSSPTWAA